MSTFKHPKHTVDLEPCFLKSKLTYTTLQLISTVQMTAMSSLEKGDKKIQSHFKETGFCYKSDKSLNKIWISSETIGMEN